MNIALFKNLRWDFETAFGPTAPTDAEYVRVSEWVDVEFPPRAEMAIQSDIATKADAINDEFDTRKRQALERIGIKP